MSRYAMSEQPYLISLARQIAELRGDEASLHEVGRICPTGGLDSVPIIQRLFDSMSGLGAHRSVAQIWGRQFPGTSFLGVGRGVALGSCNLTLPIPNPKSKVQTEVMKVPSSHLRHVDFNILLACK